MLLPFIIFVFTLGSYGVTSLPQLTPPPSSSTTNKLNQPKTELSVSDREDSDSLLPYAVAGGALGLTASYFTYRHFVHRLKKNGIPKTDHPKQEETNSPTSMNSPNNADNNEDNNADKDLPEKQVVIDQEDGKTSVKINPYSPLSVRFSCKQNV